MSFEKRIAAEVERRPSVVNVTEQAITANLSRAERLCQAILKKAFRGELVPQDSTASATLECIRQAQQSTAR